MGEAPDLREQGDCPSPEACDQSCDQHEKDAYRAGYEQAREDFARLIEEHAEKRALTAFQPWYNPLAGARAEGRVGGLDKAAQMVRDHAFPPGRDRE